MTEPWSEALLAAALFAIDPPGLGISLHAQAGPVRDNFLSALRGLLPGTRLLRTPAAAGDDALLGGLDLAATLQTGRPVGRRGLLARAHGGILLVAMAERLAAGTAARLTAAMDAGTVTLARDGLREEQPALFGVLALDESEDESPAPALLDRLAFHLDLRAIGYRETGSAGIPAERIAAAAALYPETTIEDEAMEALCGSALALGIGPLRASLLAVKAARAHAALAGRLSATLEDAAVAARLVLAPRATLLPADASPPPPPEDSPDPGQQDSSEQDNPGTPPADIVLDAARAAIPRDLLARLAAPTAQRSRTAQPGKSGQKSRGQRGRPAGIREAAPRDGERLNLAETLRAAAPWQRLRRAETARTDQTILIRPRDFRTVRQEQRARTTTIFIVDASGSAAFNRLAEAKGAVEMLLADCYRRRDEVAVLAFRGQGTSLLLPPTRSLVRAKRSLAALPGGGPTPLAAGIQAGASLALAVRRGGFTPTLVFLTDGQGNIALDGTQGRARAAEDAALAGRRLRAAALRTVLVDMAPRPQAAARSLAGTMGALYLPLPYADAAGLARRVKAAAT